MQENSLFFMAVCDWAVMLKTCFFVKLTSYFEGSLAYVHLLERTVDTKSGPKGIDCWLFGVCELVIFITVVLFCLVECSACPRFLTS